MARCGWGLCAEPAIKGLNQCRMHASDLDLFKALMPQCNGDCPEARANGAKFKPGCVIEIVPGIVIGLKHCPNCGGILTANVNIKGPPR